jgi:hypothetical protein
LAQATDAMTTSEKALAALRRSHQNKVLPYQVPSLSSAQIAEVKRLSVDSDELIERVRFALAEPYAHGVVTMSRVTAEAVLLHLSKRK